MTLHLLYGFCWAALERLAMWKDLHMNRHTVTRAWEKNYLLVSDMLISSGGRVQFMLITSIFMI